MADVLNRWLKKVKFIMIIFDYIKKGDGNFYGTPIDRDFFVYKKGDIIFDKSNNNKLLNQVILGSGRIYYLYK